MRRSFGPLMIVLLLASSCDSEDARQRDVIRDLVSRLDVNDWRNRREIRRQIQGQGLPAVGVLWESCDTDSVEELRQITQLLRNLDAWTPPRWTSRRHAIRQRHTSNLGGTREEALVALETLSLLGDTSDASGLCELYALTEEELGEKAYATALRLGLPPVKSPDPKDRRREHLQWLGTHSEARRETLLWESLPKAADASERQKLLEGLIGAVTADPDQDRNRAQEVWTIVGNEEDVAVRNSAVLLLGCLGDKRFVPLLLDKGWLSAGDFRTRTAVSWALNELGFENPQPRP